MSVTKVTSMMSTGTKGGDIPSASTLVIDTDGDFFDITGTTGITAMTVDAGRRFTLQFDGAVTLTHGSSLYLPGATNFTTEANDSLDFIATAANTVRCTGYALKDGGSVVAPALGGQYKLITGSWDLATTGDLVITGVGFAPKYIMGTALRASLGTGNIGMGDDDLTDWSIYDQNEYASDQWGAVTNTKFFSVIVAGLNIAYLTVTAYGSDGITFSRTKANSPTGTGYYGITFFG
jgi:hypothetical protein